MAKPLDIESPKRAIHSTTEWESFFPYYAGFPETFATSILQSAALPTAATVLDPWNGSGTTTYVASMLGIASTGIDINPAMLIVARSRLLPVSEADSLVPLARELMRARDSSAGDLAIDDPLLHWFSDRTATSIRTIERRIRHHLVGGMTITPNGINLNNISGLAATLYVALFSVCRRLASRYRSSNPTWVRRPKNGEARIDTAPREITTNLIRSVEKMALALVTRAGRELSEYDSTLRIMDTAEDVFEPETIDFVLTSPPYCTRIDYTAATRIELAVISPLLSLTFDQLKQRMIGSTLAPRHEICISKQWGSKCKEFLEAITTHKSKASDGYYLRTHLDYFDKISRSIANIADAMKSGARAVIVVQDSYYKDIHNDLPAVVTEIGELVGLQMQRRVDFPLARSMAGINPYTKKYRRSTRAVEAVLCLQKT